MVRKGLVRASRRQCAELASIAYRAIPSGISRGDAQELIDAPSAFIAHVRKYFHPEPEPAPDPAALLRRRIAAYREVGINPTFRGLKVPHLPSGFLWPIPVMRGMTSNRAFALCAEQFPSWRYTDNLDLAIAQSDRDPADRSYVVWVRNRVEADEELEGACADQFKDRGIAGITLTERLLLEWFYCKETGEHLDIEGWTLCAGSRDSDGNVPEVNWNSNCDRFEVDVAPPQNSANLLRARAVAP